MLRNTDAYRASWQRCLASTVVCYVHSISYYDSFDLICSSQFENSAIEKQQPDQIKVEGQSVEAVVVVARLQDVERVVEDVDEQRPRKVAQGKPQDRSESRKFPNFPPFWLSFWIFH